MTLAARQVQDDAVNTCENCGKKTGWFRFNGKLLCGDCDKEARTPKSEEFDQSKPLFLPETTHHHIERDILGGRADLTQNEAGTNPIRVGDSTEQMLRAGFKAIIDQNNIIIRQNELIRRQMKPFAEAPKT